MNKTLILHIGCYKKGSTSIQNFLFKNREILLEEDINYLFSEDGCVQTGQQVKHRDLSYEELLKVFDESPGSTHILSDECLWNNRLKNKSVILKAIFESKIYNEVKLIGYVRRQDYLVESFYKQEYKNGMHYIQGMSLEDFYMHLERTNTLRVSDVLKPFTLFELKPKIFLRPFESSLLKDKDVVTDFTNVLGIDKLSFKKAQNMNSSISDSQCYISHILFKTLKEITGEKFISGDNKHKIIKLINNLEGVFTLNEEFLSKELREKIVETYIDNNIDIAQQFNFPTESLFSSKI